MKNIVHNYSEAEIKVREATSNDPWGPSSSLMSEIADLTYNVVAFSEIMSMIWKRLNDHGKNWRHVYKVSAYQAGHHTKTPVGGCWAGAQRAGAPNRLRLTSHVFQRSRSPHLSVKFLSRLTVAINVMS